MPSENMKSNPPTSENGTVEESGDEVRNTLFINLGSFFPYKLCSGEGIAAKTSVHLVYMSKCEEDKGPSVW